MIINNGHILLAYGPRPVPLHYYELNKSFYCLPGRHIDLKDLVPKWLEASLDVHYKLK